MVGIHQVRKVFQVFLDVLDMLVPQDLLDPRQDIADLRPCDLSHIVLLEGLEDLLAEPGDPVFLPLALDGPLLYSHLVLLEHALADDSREQRDHAEGAKNDKYYEEREQAGMTPVDVAGLIEPFQVRGGHDLEERQHRARHTAKVEHQEVVVWVLQVRLAVRPGNEDGADVQSEGHEEAHPNDGLSRLREAKRDQVELLQIR
mmetsp:Transcript_140785/g.450072  ORF Transcript_140785/g.450072 Transcript_140785/m.450072 type:complete len:202 (+) Transcript_140785:622-1227(+)